MHERSHTTPRRRGPKHPLPNARYNGDLGATEPPYYTIDNTEDIYGTNLLPSQRCYIDPWDLENYDYVRSKLHDRRPPTNCYYETTIDEKSLIDENYLHASRTREKLKQYPQNSTQEFQRAERRMAATMPRRSTARRQSHLQCNLECCSAVYPNQHFNNFRSNQYADKYDDYMTYMTQNLHDDGDDDNNDGDYLEQQTLYNGYGEGGNASNSSNGRHSSIGEEGHTAFEPYAGRSTLQRNMSPKLEFPAPPRTQPPPPATPMSPSYDYCNPYATLQSYCSIPECYECITKAEKIARETPLIYAAPSTFYGTTTAANKNNTYGTTRDFYDAGATSTLGHRRVSPSTSSSLYGGIYSNKFGLSKKGLLQIDYSCSWNDLDRFIGRNY